MIFLDALRPPAGLRVLVTAGAKGTGAAVARAFHEAGAYVHVCDIDRAALDRLTAQWPGMRASMADAAIEAEVDRVFDDVRGTLGGLDVLVNNAAIAGPTGPVQALDAALWERTVAVNLLSQLLFARRAVPLLSRSTVYPCIVHMATAAGRTGCAQRAPYAATQSAVIGLMQSLAAELQAQGVRANAILRADLSAEDSGLAALGEGVAALALFLCSPAARHITGQAVGVAPAIGPPPAAGGAVDAGDTAAPRAMWRGHIGETASASETSLPGPPSAPARNHNDLETR